MIRSFSTDTARRLFDGERIHGIGWEQIQKVARRKLLAVHAAVLLEDLRAPPNNQLEALRGDRIGQHSIRVNDQWRICFVWRKDGPHDVEIVDYHD